MKEDNKEDNLNKENEVSIAVLMAAIYAHFKYLRSKWITILIFLIIGVLAGVFYAARKQPKYIATTTFTIEQSNQAPSGIAGLASQLGLNLGGSKGSIFDGYNIIAFFKSRLMIQKTLLSEAPFEKGNELLINRYIEFNHYRDGWKKDPKLKDLTFKANDSLSRLQDSVLGVFYTNIIYGDLYIDKVDDKKLNILDLSYTCGDELFSKEFSEVLTKNVIGYYTNMQTSKTINTINILQYQTDSVRNRLNQSLTSVASSMDNIPNANPLKKVLTVSSQDKSVQAEIDRSALIQLASSLQAAKISLNQETPLIDIIDTPILPLDIQKTSKTKGGLIGGFVAFVLALFILTFKRKAY